MEIPFSVGEARGLNPGQTFSGIKSRYSLIKQKPIVKKSSVNAIFLTE